MENQTSRSPDWPTLFEATIADRLEADGSHDISHFRRVWQNAQDIAMVEGGDTEILAAAAWLHDLVNPPKDSPQRSQASELSAEAAEPILQNHCFPHAKIGAVKHAILTHSFSANLAPKTLDAEIIQDADRLDALGAIGIARTFHVAGQMNSSLFHPTDPQALDRNLDDTAYALDHFQTKLFQLPEKLRTKTGRKIAERRVVVMKNFVSELLKEIRG